MTVDSGIVLAAPLLVSSGSKKFMPGAARRSQATHLSKPLVEIDRTPSQAQGRGAARPHQNSRSMLNVRPQIRRRQPVELLARAADLPDFPALDTDLAETQRCVR